MIVTGKGHSARTHQRGRLIWVAMISLGLTLTMYVRISPSVEECLAEFDAQRAIPDKQNAALVYAQLLTGCEESDLSLYSKSMLDNESERIQELLRLDEILDWDAHGSLVKGRPWTRTDFPELAEWLDDHTKIMSVLAQASQYKQLVLPVDDNSTSSCATFSGHFFDLIIRCIRLMKLAIGFDLGEGRLEEVIQRNLTIIRIGQHLLQQPSWEYRGIGKEFECFGMSYLNRMLLDDRNPISKRQLKEMEASFEALDIDWEQMNSEIDYVSSLYEKRERAKVTLKQRWNGFWNKRSHCDGFIVPEYLPPSDAGLQDSRKGFRILIELRRFKHETGHWPTQRSQGNDF
jgi:hypothetical protein